MDVSSVVNALSQKVASDVLSVQLVSDPTTTLSFRPISLSQQKALSKIVMADGGSPAATYKSTLGLISSLCLNKDKLDYKKLTELDRMLILAAFCNRNYFFNEFTVKCKSCGSEDQVKMDLTSFIQRFGDLTITSSVTVETNSNEFVFKLGIPNVEIWAEVEEAAEKTAPAVTDSKESSPMEAKSKHIENIFTNDQTIKAFIKGVTVRDKINPTDVPLVVDMSAMKLADISTVCNALPLEIFTDPNSGIFKAIFTELIKPMTTLSIDMTCKKCNTKVEGGMPIQLFFI